MLERRQAVSILGYEVGAIAVDEHTWMPVIVCDKTDMGARLALLDTTSVPETFLLKMLDAEHAQLCKTIWRTPEVIGAWFDGQIKF